MNVILELYEQNLKPFPETYGQPFPPREASQELLRETGFSSQSKSHGAIISIAEIPREFSTAKINSATRGIREEKAHGQATPP
jgi:hypothetical protein